MIAVKDLKFTYKNGHEALRGFDFSIEKGEIFGFLGPSGAGKTTTQKLLIGLLGGYGGSIRINGKERSKWGNEFFSMIGVAFEQPNLYVKLTGLENMKLMGSLYPQKCLEPKMLLKRVDLADAGNVRVEHYSKGMKMRLNFIRALQHEPEIYFFDEPTAGLDPVNAQLIKNIIRELKENGKTIFLTTHDMTVADQLCGRVAFIADGKLALSDSPQSLKIKYGTGNVNVLSKDGKVSSFPLEGLGDNADFISMLKSGRTASIHSDDATLEGIFIKVTGRELQ